MPPKRRNKGRAPAEPTVTPRKSPAPTPAKKARWPEVSAAAVSIIGGSILAVAGYSRAFHSQSLTAAERTGNGGWHLDPNPSAIDTSRCTIPRVHASHLSQVRFDAEFWQQQPVLIDGLIDHWPAFERWTRASLHDGPMGARVVAAGDGANIVQSGGRSGGAALSLASYLNQMANLTASWKDYDQAVAAAAANATIESPAVAANDDLFNFDADFLEAMPELAEDFSVPNLFHKWAGAAKMSLSAPPPPPPLPQAGRNSPYGKAPPPPPPKLSYSMLSLGASRSGLPWHVHGETWLGLVFGAKRWLLYGPSSESPLGIRQRTTFRTPLMGAYAWLQEVYPQVLAEVLLQDASEEDAAGGVAAEALGAGVGGSKAAERLRVGSSGSVPMECVQRAGEVIYLPAGWKHLTVNVGEAIGVGSQAGYDDHQRLEDSLKALQVDSSDVLSHKGAALALVQRAMEAQQQAAAAAAAQREYSSARSRGSKTKNNNNNKKSLLEANARNDWRAALGHLSQALALAPAHPEICMVYAEVLHMAEQPDEAVSAIAKCAALYRPSLGESVSPPSASRTSAGDHDNRNTQDNAEAVAEAPIPSAAGAPVALAAKGLSSAALAAAHLNFGRGYLAVNRPREALDELLRALTLVPNLAGAHQARGDAFAMLGQWQEATKSFAEAMHLRPQDTALQRDFQRARQRASSLRS